MIQHYSRFVYTLSNEHLIPNKKKYDNTIYSFDIETTSFIIYNNKIYDTNFYDKLEKKEQSKCTKHTTMYVWQLGINENVYFGRTWDELKKFISIIDKLNEYKKIIWIHNAAFEFTYLHTIFNFCNVFARKTHKVMRADFIDYNIEIRCTYVLTNYSLKNLAKYNKLKVQKITGDINYSKLRHSMTHLTKKEFRYIENDCLIIYYYIKDIELKKYKYINKIPLTATGHVRRELQQLLKDNRSYHIKTRKAINTDPYIYNFLVKTYMGGYTHANWKYSDRILKNVDSWDLSSSYPAVIVLEKYPMTKFQKINLLSHKYMSSAYAYLLHVKFYNLECQYLNTFISKSKVINGIGIEEDNGRIIRCEECEMFLTDIDFKLYLKTYYESEDRSEYEILESYSAKYDYLPIDLVRFVLYKYIDKTQLKGIEAREVEYQHKKSDFNAIYGMMCTNTIRDEVIYNEILQKWNDKELPLSNHEIIENLENIEKKSFLSFAWGVWVTSYARSQNLLQTLVQLDEYCVYSDTDSLKLLQGYDKKIIYQYNLNIINKIRTVSKKRKIDIEHFMPRDINNKAHPIGLFEYEKKYSEFITQGAKKYACRESKTNELSITVSGVPKFGVKCLKNDIRNFKDDLLFDFKHTNKNTLLYLENLDPVYLTDYEGNTLLVNDKSGCCVLPASYLLSKSDDYNKLLKSSNRCLYNF